MDEVEFIWQKKNFGNFAYGNKNLTFASCVSHELIAFFTGTFVVYWHQNFGPMVFAWGTLAISYTKNQALRQSNDHLLFFAKHQIVIVLLLDLKEVVYFKCYWVN